MHETLFEDSIWNLFYSRTDDFKTLSINDYIRSEEDFRIGDYKNLWTQWNMSFELDTEKKEAKRVRYSFWMAISDVGGVYDGLSLIVKILIAPFAAS